jgi:signal transduction histidine kinase
MSIDLLILLLSDIANFMLGVAVYVRSPHAKVNRIFAGLSASIIGWSTLNYAADQAHTPEVAVWLTRLTLFGGLCILLSVLLLSWHFPREIKKRNKFNELQPYILVVVAILSFTPWVVQGVTPTVNGASLEVGVLYGLYVIGLLQGAGTVIGNFIRQYRDTHVRAEQDQIRIVLWGLTLYGLFTIASNVVVPLFVDSWSTSRFGPIFSLFVVALTGYAIIKHRLFDIRLIIARSIGYVFSVIVLAAIYGFLVFGVARLAFGLEISLMAQVFLSLATGIAGLSFQRFRKGFDRLTSSVFFRDAYEPQVLFDRLNKVLVSTVDLRYLLKQSSTVVMDGLKIGYCTVILQDGSGVRMIGTDKTPLDVNKLDRLFKAVKQSRDQIIAADFLDEKHGALSATLSEYNIAVMAHLTSGTKRNQESLGYLVLGQKKSGNTYTTQDLGVVNTIVNELIIATQNALRYEEIENFAATLQTRVDEATRKLRRTNEKLKALDEAKDDFVSMASHQLRTPLTSIKGYTSMVLEGDAGKINATQRKLLEQSFFSSQRMVYLIADLLNVSRLKTGKFIIEPAPVNLAEVVQQEIGQLQDVASGRQLTLDYEQPKAFPTLLLDETKTRQVIMNFVDNAIYYTPAGGHITVQLSETSQSVEFRVTDDGIGVPKSEQPHLFTKFYRAGNARKARPDGTGLGLFMAKKVIVAEGGAIIFDTQEGKGSTFGFTFPKSKLVSADAPIGQPIVASVTPD